MVVGDVFRRHVTKRGKCAGKTEEQQNARLTALREDPKFQISLNSDEIPVHFEGGARCDDTYPRIHDENTTKSFGRPKRPLECHSKINRD